MFWGGNGGVLTISTLMGSSTLNWESNHQHKPIQMGAGVGEMQLPFWGVLSQSSDCKLHLTNCCPHECSYSLESFFF